ncbi:MAG: tetratricopeptide repeat protein [Akkermansiaceae bacterium]|jgi:hypothetical protein|nr:tetratricopeptide repeat protein [Akkermansiaceae bacterium]MDP4648158.1 tetratricopeptide repeat protein [Akkermansiaceae bacterium]MDP4778914.1 tetratricopeptide repeat protein [Akkermansiaceae bacterium]MDP4898824.1 tetratricopeptide repeat protein [Akkermansiaceae bacterium]MDP4994728.1 tetratricopeptide repeat protein [Akkermansiaceae bacterium]
MKFDGVGDFRQAQGTMKGQRLFVGACCGLGLVAFSQLLVAGMALAVRMEESREVKIVEKEVEKIVPIRINVPVEGEELVRPLVKEDPVLPPVPAPEPLEMPGIVDPRSERLVEEGRKARIAGDMGMAIVKLEEALQESPEDPTVLYELGMVHESMEVFDKASEYYERVFRLGVSGAGGLYQAAATKLRDGFAQPADMIGKVALGRVRIFNDANADGGQRVILTVPVQKAPGEELDTQDMEVSVLFFNKDAKGEIQKLQDDQQHWAVPSWASLPFDWAGGEETLRMDYNIPEQDAQTAHLFGQPNYYGQVVTLTYKGEVLDVQAWPRDLAARIGQVDDGGMDDFPEFLQGDMLPPDFDPENPLLMPLPER